MYIKKPVLICSAIVLVIVTALLSIGVINPFGFTEYGELIKFSYISKLIDSNYYEDVNTSDYLNSAIEGMAVATKDPYTRYLWGNKASDYMESIEGNYKGIGVYIVNNTEDDTIEVVSSIVGTPAEEAGLTTGDKILAVNGETFTGSQIDGAVKAMKGEVGTEVTITVFRCNTEIIEDVTLVRSEIEIKNVRSDMVIDRIGRITISQFTDNVAREFVNEYNNLREQGMERLILDLRNNPGGLVESAVDIANMFLEDGSVIVYTLDKNENRVDFPASGDAAKIPIVILTNQGTASAGEILTGALKDYGIGYQIGEKTYGKGVVQSVYQIGDGVLSVTSARYFTPNGVCIHGAGIEPDEVVTMDVEKYLMLSDLTLNEDTQLQAAVNYLNK